MVNEIVSMSTGASSMVIRAIEKANSVRRVNGMCDPFVPLARVQMHRS